MWTDELLSQLRARDARAIALVRARLLPSLRTLCAGMLANKTLGDEAAEDVVNDFLLSYVETVRQPTAIPAYVRLMAVRRCRRLRAYQQRQVSHTESIEHRPSPESQVIVEDQRRHLGSKLADCLDRLTPRSRTVLRLRYEHELKLEEIGSLLGSTKQYASRVVTLALAKLHKCMGRPS